MKKIYYKILTGLIAVFIMSGCSEEPELTVLKTIKFEGELTASKTEIVITEENQHNDALTLNWSAVNYFIDAPVTYSYQITVISDTASWSTSLEREIGDDILSATLTGKELNDLALEMGLTTGESSKVAIRIKSYVDRSAFSNSVTVSLTPFTDVVPLIAYPSLYIAGDYQGWDITNPDSISSKLSNDIYEGYIYIPPGGTNEFKLYAQKDWSPTSYGNGGDSTVIVANYAGDNFVAPSDGYYLFAVDLNTMEYFLMKIESWGIIGEATPNGWDSDTDLTFDPETGLWSVTADMKATGFFKFRANNTWQLDMGLDENGYFEYANHPWEEYFDCTNLTVSTDGNYTIILDLRFPGNYSYDITLN